MAFYFPTKRLIIRPWRESDRPDFERMVLDPDMMRYINGRPWDDAQIDEFMQRQRHHMAQHGVCFGACQSIESDAVIGLAGMQPIDSGEFEIGWWVWKDYWGQGLALEALQPFLTHARNMALGKLLAVIDPPNSASIRVAEKLGMHFDRTVPANQTIASRGDKLVAIYELTL